jgi:outer membrane biosynthesis protein TonB
MSLSTHLRTKLEPLRPAVTAAICIHGLLGLVVFWWATHTGALSPPQQAVVWSSPAAFLGEGLSPAAQLPQVQSTVSQPPAPVASTPPVKAKPVKAIAVTPEMLARLSAQQPVTATPAALTVQAPATMQTSTATPEPPVGVSRTITVSRPTAAQVPAHAGLLDMASLDAASTNEATNMDAVDRAIIQVFKTHWLPPSSAELDPDRSSVGIDIAVGRTGRVLSFKPTRPSGHTALDASVLSAANKVNSIGVPLPQSYIGDRYEPRLNFHAE